VEDEGPLVVALDQGGCSGTSVGSNGFVEYLILGYFRVSDGFHRQTSEGWGWDIRVLVVRTWEEGSGGQLAFRSG
jgi:hypothetical protein